MSKEAMKLALEALKRMKRYGNTFAYRSHEQNPYEQVCEAIAAIEALAEQPAPAPGYCTHCKKYSIAEPLPAQQKPTWGVWPWPEKPAEQPAKQDIPDLIAGTLGVSRGTAYDMMREALKAAAPVQEPVGRLRMGPKQDFVTTGAAGDLEINVWHSVYTTPPAAPVQEPVIFYRCTGCDHAYEERHPTSCDCMEGGDFKRIEYYTAPAAQRQWVGLTDAEILEVLCIWPDADDDPDDYMEDIREARAIEAKLREKNT